MEFIDTEQPCKLENPNKVYPASSFGQSKMKLLNQPGRFTLIIVSPTLLVWMDLAYERHLLTAQVNVSRDPS